MKQQLKNSVSIVMVSIIMLIAGNSVQAQQRGQQGQQGPPPLPTDGQIEQMVDDLSEALSLSKEQEKQVSGIYFDHFAVVEKKMNTGRPDRKEMEKLKTSFEKEVKAVLTKDQQKLYDSYLKEQQQNRPQGQRK